MVRRRSLTNAQAFLFGGLLASLGACSQFGIPDFPPELRPPLQAPGELFVVYHPDAVLGFGHTGLIIAHPEAAGFERYDQYASSEIDYERRHLAGETWFWEALTARLPPLAGGTREYVTRRSASSAGELVNANEFAVPVAVDPAARRAIQSAADARFRDASSLESPEARRYYLLTNNCQTFLIDLLRTGGLPEDEFFPKYLMETYLAQYRERLESPRGAQP